MKRDAMEGSDELLASVAQLLEVRHAVECGLLVRNCRVHRVLLAVAVNVCETSARLSEERRRRTDGEALEDNLGSVERLNGRGLPVRQKGRKQERREGISRGRWAALKRTFRFRP